MGGAVPVPFACMADPAKHPWIEFDPEWSDADTSAVHLASNMVAAAGGQVTKP